MISAAEGALYVMKRIHLAREITTVALFFGLLAGPAMAAPDLDGVWILYRAEKFGRPVLTVEGQQKKDSYDFRVSDPALKCIPASWTRVYSNPNTPLEISQHDDRIDVRYELFDIVRTIPLVNSLENIERGPASTNFTTLGSSVGWYDGDTLVVHTNHYGAESRVLTTIRGWAGLHQSSLMATTERYTRDGDTLLIDITHFDPVMYREPLTVNYTLDLETEFEVQPYGCDPADAAINSIQDEQ
jgi:hypothetical protein